MDEIHGWFLCQVREEPQVHASPPDQKLLLHPVRDLQLGKLKKSRYEPVTSNTGSKYLNQVGIHRVILP